MRTRHLASVAALAGASLLATPTAVQGFTLLGFTLSLTQRDFRVWNNFIDFEANNNTVPHANFPGATGATMAIWKGVVEWGSFRHGPAGAGDPTQGALGGDPLNNAVVDNSLGNFDSTWQGTTTNNGGQFGNVISASQTSLGAGVLAVTFPNANGWQILYNDPSFIWDDNPNSFFCNGSQSNFDIQGIGCHEFGHALGLGHTNVNAATMFPSAGCGSFSVALRSIDPDDGNGVKAAYGVAAGTKPRITSIMGSVVPGTQLTIVGTNFHATANEVWFTSTAANGLAKIAANVPSTGGGTQIQVTVPTTAPLPTRGDVLVKIPGAAHSALSNAWPVDNAVTTPPSLASITPDPVPIFSASPPTMTLTGTSLGAVSQVDVGTVSLTAGGFTVVNDTTITFAMPLAGMVGGNSVTVMNAAGTSNALTLTVDPVQPPLLDAPTITATGLTWTATTWTNPGDLVFLLVSGSNLPSVIPGIVSLGIGNGFTDLVNFPVQVASATQGKTMTSIVTPAGFAGASIFFQVASVPPTLVTPWPATNVVNVFIIF